MRKNKNSVYANSPEDPSIKALRKKLLIGAGATAIAAAGLGAIVYGVGELQNNEPRIEVSVDDLQRNPETYLEKGITVNGEIVKIGVDHSVRSEPIYNSYTKQVEVKIVTDTTTLYELKGQTEASSIIVKSTSFGSGYGVPIGFESDHSGTVTVEGSLVREEIEGDGDQVVYVVDAEYIAEPEN